MSMTSTFGVATVSNPRPFNCKDCVIAFRIHGHLAKHLRSKMHVLKLECLGKLPFGTYTEIERSGINLTEIDTTDCENSLQSLRMLAQKLNVKDPTNVLPTAGGSGIGLNNDHILQSGGETDSCDDNFNENENEEEDGIDYDEDDNNSNNSTNYSGDNNKRKVDETQPFGGKRLKTPTPQPIAATTTSVSVSGIIAAKIEASYSSGEFV